LQVALITGATGFLGREVVRSLLARDAEATLVALVRAPDEAALARRRRRLVARLREADAARVIAVRGDVTEPRLGLSPKAYLALASRVERLVHVAAATRFDLPVDEARRRNVAGTAHVIDLCRTIKRRGGLGRLDHVSTAFVAGDRTDLVQEDELDAGQGFRNTYERSKFEAERLCVAMRCELPVVIHRPSIIVGHSITGETTSYKGLYGPLQVLVPFYRRWQPLTRFVPLPACRRCPLDVVPVDWVGDAVATLYHRSDADGRSYHLAAGPTGAPTVEEVAALTCEYFGARSRRLVDPRGPLGCLGRAAAPLLRLAWPALARRVANYLPYMISNPSFDTRNTRAAGLAPPPFATYFPHVLRHADTAGFGRRTPSRTPAMRRASVEGTLVVST